MVRKTTSSASVLRLPVSLLSRGDTVHLSRELEMLDEKLVQAKHRSDEAVSSPHLSQPLEELSHLNQLDLANPLSRQRLQAFLKELKTEAPVIHMSFATEPSSVVSEKLITWLRAEIHPLILLNIGLQPSIAAGCIVRTRSKYFDFSMRQHLLEHRSELMARLKVQLP